MRGYITPHWTADQVYAVEYQSQENIRRGFTPIEYGDSYKSTEVSMDIYQGAHAIFDLGEFDKSFSWLDNKMYAVHRMFPRCSLPEHSDKYPYYSRANDISDLDQIQRVIVFLEDKKPGHRFTLEGVDLEYWRAGDWISWQGLQQHGAYNEGNEIRYTLQITGTIRALNPK
jgi:hypothetical protein